MRQPHTNESHDDYLFAWAKDVSDRFGHEYFFLETGTHIGDTGTRIIDAIAESRKNRWFISVDPYGGKPYKLQDGEYTNLFYDETSYQRGMLRLYMHSFIRKVRFAHYRLKSQDFIKCWDGIEFWSDGSRARPEFAFVFLDGEHNDETVKLEFDYFFPKVPSGGVISIDNYDHLIDGEAGVRKMFSGYEGEWTFYDKLGNYRCYFQKA